MRKNQTYKHSNIRYNSLTHANQGFVVTSTCLCRSSPFRSHPCPTALAGEALLSYAPLRTDGLALGNEPVEDDHRCSHATGPYSITVLRIRL